MKYKVVITPSKNHPMHPMISGERIEAVLEIEGGATNALMPWGQPLTGWVVDEVLPDDTPPEVELPEQSYEVPFSILSRVLDSLRLVHIYVLKNTHPEALPEDFKPHKWEGGDVEFAKEATEAYHDLVHCCHDQMMERIGEVGTS